MPGRRLWRAGRRKGIWGARLVRGFVLQHRGKSVLKREDDRGERCQAVGKTTAISVPRVRAHSRRSLEWVVRNRATAESVHVRQPWSRAERGGGSAGRGA